MPLTMMAIQVDVDQVRPLAQQFQIAAMPTFVFVVKGLEVNRVKGFHEPSICAALAGAGAKHVEGSGDNKNKKDD